MVGLRRALAASAALMTASGLLAACSAGASSGDTLNWYINPDAGGQAKVAENCSTDDYKIDGPGPAAERQRAAHPALAATRGGGPRDRHHEHRPALHRRVRERRLPGHDPRPTCRAS